MTGGHAGDGGGTCPGCGLSPAHEVLDECWAALSERDRLGDCWATAPDPDALALLGADLPTRRALRWLRRHDCPVWPLAGSVPGLATPETEGFYARAGVVESLRRRFYRGPITGALVVERLASTDGWLAVRRPCRAGTLVPREALGGRAAPDVRTFELVDPPSGRDPAELAADRLLLQRTGDRFAADLFAHDGWTGERVAVAPDSGAVPAAVERRLRAEMASSLL
jgi:hypothetical protein